MTRKVFIGVGHGGKDPGAVANGFREKDLNLSVAKAVHAELCRHGVETKMSRTDDAGDSLDDRVKTCNAYLGSDGLAVDIHHNAGGGDGAEAYYHYKGGTSKTCAENILAEIAKIGQNSRGAKIKKGSDGRDYYGFIRETRPPAVIVECAFLDNETDVQIVDSEEKRTTMGKAVAKGILKTLGVEFQEETPPKNNGEKETLSAWKEAVRTRLAELLSEIPDRLLADL